MPPGMHPIVRFIVIFCLQHWVYFILFAVEMQGKIISLICIYCNIFIKSIFVQINFNKMLLNKSKYKVFLAISVYMSHNIFINIQKTFRLNAEISMNILFYDMGSYTCYGFC